MGPVGSPEGYVIQREREGYIFICIYIYLFIYILLCRRYIGSNRKVQDKWFRVSRCIIPVGLVKTQLSPVEVPSNLNV